MAECGNGGLSTPIIACIAIQGILNGVKVECRQCGGDEGIRRMQDYSQLLIGDGWLTFAECK